MSCIPVNLTILGLVHSPEEATQGLNQLAEKVSLKRNNNNNRVWCSRIVYKTIGYLGWSLKTSISNQIEEKGIYLVGKPQND